MSNVALAREPLAESVLRLRDDRKAFKAMRLCVEGRRDDAIRDCSEIRERNYDCEYAALVYDYARGFALSRAEEVAVKALICGAKGQLDEALALAKEAIELDASCKCARGIRDFVERVREKHLNYATETHRYALKPVKPEAGETGKQVYNETMKETAKFRAVAEQEGFSVADFRKLIDNAKAARAEVTKRGTVTARAKGKPRRLKWEKDALPDENPAAFAWRAYQAEAKAKTLHRGLIGQEDPLLRRDLNNWLRTHAMPDGIDIPTKPEWNTRRLAEAASPPRAVRVLTEEGRLHEAARYRARKAALVTTM